MGLQNAFQGINNALVRKIANNAMSIACLIIHSPVIFDLSYQADL